MKRNLALCLSALLLVACSGDKTPAAADAPQVSQPAQAAAQAPAAVQQVAAAPQQAKQQARQKAKAAVKQATKPVAKPVAKPVPAETQERIRATERVIKSETTVS